jgi:hypothetical protein
MRGNNKNVEKEICICQMLTIRRRGGCLPSPPHLNVTATGATHNFC